MAEDDVQASVQSNGHRWLTLPPELADHPEMIRNIMVETRAELNERDESAEQRARRAERHRATMAGLLTVALLVIGFLVWQRRDIQAFVQVVQETEDHRLVQIGVPQHLLAYTPPDGAYYDMLREWIRRVYWRGKDRAKEETVDGRWVDVHTCPSAKKMLDRLRATARAEAQALRFKEQPLVEIQVEPPLKTQTPDTYQVAWKKITTSTQYPKGKPEQFTTLFTVGRLDLKTLKDAEDNRLGICVKTVEDTDPTN